MELKKNTEVISRGYYLHRADVASSTYNVTGYGIKVGVLSNGMNHWEQSARNGDLPNSISFINTSQGASDDTTLYPGSEGTAMQEIIHDFAPNANLYFGAENNNTTPLDFRDEISELANNGCKIIVDDVSWIIGYSFFRTWNLLR